MPASSEERAISSCRKDPGSAPARSGTPHQCIRCARDEWRCRQYRPLVYAEALKDAKGNKGNRNEIDGKTIAGVRDEFRLDGGERRRFQTLWFRTYRYVQLEIETGEEPLRLHDLHGIFVGYPFKLVAQFDSDLAWLADMWDDQLARRAALRLGDVFRYPVLRTAPVRRRHTHPGPDHALHEQRRSSRASGDRAFRPLADP